ncbi:PaaX family transcriptional regulator C-terminal domain-containing protein [Kitasatospora sp. SUK 42]|uniref:PaaX family transcriptional regulator C-terminal domain-containing protein n=1 Tax=Kitasatospora sp. SUK 42 TaxID=1588882 RepID=UPI001C314766|nr:PaaX family transcriptional regulator C-terminal domain-containing protein [Kitasatospora sp. SUK 42]MBV2156562.1 transcriptional regulator [Kitasatospora sp. SUK 42]
MSEYRAAPRTVVEACFDPQGTASLDYVYDVAAAAGLSDQPVRLAIRRLAAAGVLRQEGRGRKGRLVLTDAGRLRADQDVRHVELAYAQDAGLAAWDGLWRLYTFSVPEQHRPERDALRTALTRLGGAPLAPGAYVSPHDLLEELAAETSEATVGSYLITAEATRLIGPGFTGPAAIAERLWPAAGTVEAYQPLAAALDEDSRHGERGSVELVVAALRLAEAFDHALERDPLLPLELRPAPWPPTRIRRDFQEAWTAIRDRAPDLSLFRAFDTPGPTELNG